MLLKPPVLLLVILITVGSLANAQVVFSPAHSADGSKARAVSSVERSSLAIGGTTTNNFGNNAATVRPWTSYFLGQTKTQPGAYMGNVSGPKVCDGEGYCSSSVVPKYAASTIMQIDLNGVVTAKQPKSRFPITLGQPTGNEMLSYKPGFSIYCNAFPTWSNNANKLAGMAPDGWSFEGGDPNYGTNSGCGQYADTGSDQAFGDAH